MNGRARAITTCEFVLRSFDVDAYGCLSPQSLAGYFQEAASESADALGFGIADLNRHGLTWVLVRQKWQLDATLVLGDEIRIETWPSGIDRMAALRDFRVCRNGVEVGRAITSWFVLDVSRRRPVRPATVLTDFIAPDAEHVIQPPGQAIEPLTDWAEERHFTVRYADIDINQHVTNATYVEWALEAVDAETWTRSRVASLDLQFIAECTHGVRVTSRAVQREAGTWQHSMLRENDQKEVARAVSQWVAR
jgi:medium-chain acyl-[acyl-carrier-protein] hydrolase